MAETLRYAFIMLLSGIGIPVLAALNSQLGARLGAPVAASVVLFLVALIVCVTALVVSGQGPALAALPAQPPYLMLGGTLVAFYVLSVTFVAPRFGVGNAVFCVLMGQMIAASTIDHFGLFGAIQHPVSTIRAMGLAAMTIGLVLVQRG